MACNGRKMGFDFGLESTEVCFKRKNRWLFIIPDISAEGVNTLPPSRGARPSLSFKEMEAQHLSETVYFPAKPEWKPITLSLYDIKKPGLVQNPVFEWVKKIYDPQKDSSWTAPCDGFKKKIARLELYDGCGTTIEQWVFESIWPQSIEFGDLDMASSEVVTLELTLRYDRAYIV
jgi:hypothetical protein